MKYLVLILITLCLNGCDSYGKNDYSDMEQLKPVVID